MEERLTTLALRGGTVRDMAGLLAELVEAPCAVHDARFGRIAVGVPAGDSLGPPRLMDADVRVAPEVRAALAGLPGRAPKILGPFPRAGLHRRCLVVPIAARDDIWGYLLVGEEKSRLSTMETLVASRAATIIALNVSSQRSAAETKAYAREALVRRLIDDGGPSGAIVAQAEFHGLRSRAQYVVAILAGRDARPREFDATAVEQAAERAGIPTLWLAGAENGTLKMVVELDEDDTAQGLRDRIESLASLLDDRGALQIAVSGVCDSIHDLASAHREARQVLRILRTFADRDRSPAILTADELGPGCLLLAATDRADADRFVRTALGDVADVQNPKAVEVLQTLQVFLSESCGIRKAAARLQVHENTIRYRLGRLAAATGRDVLTDTRAQLDAQIALLILRLEGRLESSISAVS
jgi:sugar diacid utilization regulator